MKKVVLLFLAAFGCVQCGLIEHFDSIDLVNHSNRTIMAYGEWNSVSGDTSIVFAKNDLRTIRRSERESLASILGDFLDQEHLFGDRYCVFIFHPDTLEKYSWEEVVSGYKILCRYDLDVPLDLERLDKTIPYPPTKAMSGMKVFDPQAAPEAAGRDSVLQSMLRRED